jgi:metallo-beta-lactamase family protein
MAMTLNFCGAAQNVTGSCYHLAVNGQQLLIDCGFFQEHKLKSRNWDPFPFHANEIDAVLLTHAHLDHCGLLPKLRKAGFEGRIHTTPATADIAQIVMLDAAHIQEEDIRHKQQRHQREGRTSPHPYEPLFTVSDAESVLPRFVTTDYEQTVAVGDGIEATFHDAGHILGSASIMLKITSGGETRRVLFSGDLGRYDTPIIRDPAAIAEADYVIIESTYGNRLHKPNAGIPAALADVIGATVEAGGNILIPSFAVERTQELLFHLHNLQRQDRIPHLLAFVDSPMAIRVTDVFKRHPKLFDAETTAMLARGEHPCDFSGLKMSASVDQSKAINYIRGSALIIAGSGMCTGGRIKHHLRKNITRPESTILFIGYQAVGTLGRIILEGADSVRIHGGNYPVKARIHKINGFSAHGDRNELNRWISNLKNKPRRVIVSHGEPDAATAFAEFIHDQHGWDTTVAEYLTPLTLA